MTPLRFTPVEAVDQPPADSSTPAASAELLTDEEVVERVFAGETAWFEILMRRYNQRLYRVSRSIVGDDAEAEDVMQEAYVRAYQHLDQFDGRARFATWLTRIAVHEALARLRRRRRAATPGRRLTTEPRRTFYRDNAAGD